jgi:tyrosyl-tRNA synthetase
MEVNKSKVQRILTHNVSEIIVKKELEKKLLSGKKLKIKFGIDPTGTFLTLGHMVVIRKLKELQDAGHEIILLFGNFTAQIGDPTGKSETRKPLTQKQVEENAKTYLEQVGKVLDMKKNVKVVWNADWLGKFDFSDVLQLAGNFTVAQMLERDMFQERIKNEQPIGLHEFLYPLMQGYDSVELKSDLELGGTDQTFNMMAARPLQKAHNQEPQSVMTMKILVGTDGVKKMGKSEGNFIAVMDSPKDMFGRIMSIPDTLILDYFDMCTDVDKKQFKKISDQLENGTNPRDLKVLLGKSIVTMYHSEIDAEKAAEEFNTIFRKGGLPDDIKTMTVNIPNPLLIDLLLENKLVNSKGEARRLIDGGGIKVDQKKVSEYNHILPLKKEQLVQVGKRKFIKFKAT